jgi:hypothetical protein
MTRGARVGVLLLAPLFATTIAVAAPRGDSFKAAVQAALGAWGHDPAKTVEALEQATVIARARAPLKVRQVAVVNAPHTGLGLYTPAVDDVVEARALQLYIEVANFTSRLVEGAALVELEAKAEFTYLDGNESVPLGEKPLGTHRFLTRSDIGVTSFGVDVRLGETSPAGVYRARVTITDPNGNKSGSKDVRFVLR